MNITISLTPIQREILEIALSKIKRNPNHLSMNFHDSSPVNYHLKENFVVMEYKDLIKKYKSNFYVEDNIEVLDYTDKYNDEERNAVLEEEDRLTIEINDLFKNDGLYIKGFEELD